MSHGTGSVQPVAPPIGVGPNFGANNVDFEPDPPADVPMEPAPGIKFVILHFTNVSLPPNNRLEVDLGYGTDVFKEVDGPDFWTRPVNVDAFNGKVQIRYITDGDPTGGAELVEYGRGERHEETLANHDSYSNSDPFLLDLVDGKYFEPAYDAFWFCNSPPHWQNIACAAAADVRSTVEPSVCLIVDAHEGHVSTCTGTLIGPDLVITAGHCVEVPSEQIPTMSVTFDYMTLCGGEKPNGYNPVFHKVLRMVEFGTTFGGPLDYMILQFKVPPGGLGIEPRDMRQDLPVAGEQVFGIHHPNGAIKKVSPTIPNFATVTGVVGGLIKTNMDITGGSSGSGLFDTMGRFLGVLTSSVACNLGYAPSATILQNIGSTPVPSPLRDLMVILDRSGSMSMSAGTGATKIEEARDAASLFVQLVREQAGHRLGLVSFSTTATVESDLKDVEAAHKEDLVGPPPHSTGIVGGLNPGGLTTIGGGLQAATMAFPPAGPDVNRRTILLLTDGLQNMPPMIEDVTAQLSGTDVSAIGFGIESSLNGVLLTQLTQSHNGIYTRAGDGLELKKFFALAFGDIFEAGSLLDPEQVLSRGRESAEPIPFNVCGETSITVVLGWEGARSPLGLTLETPSGQIIGASDKGVQAGRGRTWRFMRVQLPMGTDHDGTWRARVSRIQSTQSPAEQNDVRFFLNVVATGGAMLTRIGETKKYFTGDRIIPLVGLANQDGFPPPNRSARVVITRPSESPGNPLVRAGRLQPPADVDGDALPSRFATLLAIEDQTENRIEYEQVRYPLYDDGSHEDGAMEPDGVFGNPLTEVLVREGNYTFHVMASYGRECSASRELTWTVHVSVGIDPTNTDVTTAVVGTTSDGRTRIRLTIVPKDGYGNYLGPGQSGEFEVFGQPGCELIGRPEDAGDGSYLQDVAWDRSAGRPVSVGITQAGRAPAILTAPGDRRPETPGYS